jgi:hypothetical protein
MGFNLPLLNRRRRIGGFSPQTLFALSEPGFWYDPSDVANLNWRRNLLTWTEDFSNAAWSKVNVTITANAAAAPDGTMSADRIVQDAGTRALNADGPKVNVTVTGDKCFSVSAKQDTARYLAIGFSNGAGLTATAVFDLQAGTLSGSGFHPSVCSAITTSITSQGSGWYRCSLGLVGSMNITDIQHIAASTAPAGGPYNRNITGDGTSGVLIWGAQLEVGSVATEYQPITTVDAETIARFPTATLYRDTAGTQPVTTPGDTVALMLDKRQGLVLGPELVTNGDFSDGSTGWTLGTDWTISSGFASRGSNATASNLAGGSGVEAGKFYRVTWTQTGSNFVAVYLGSVSGTLVSNTNTPGTYSVVALSTVAGGVVFRAGAVVASIDNISVRELPGFHATQSTTANRPTYGIVPKTGRRNLLTFTEQFDNAAWSRTGATVSGNTFTATSTSTNIFQSASFGAGLTNSYTLEAKAGTSAFCSIRSFSGSTAVGESYFNVSTGVVSLQASGHVATITPTSDGFFRCTVTATHASAPTFFAFRFSNASGSTTVSIGNTMQFRFPQLEAGSTATAYQRVTTQFDVTEAGVASDHYLFFGGSTDPRWMVTPTITPGIDKVQVFAGVRKLSDAVTFATVLETSVNAASNAGAIILRAPHLGADYAFFSRGSASLSGAVSAASYAAPITNVLTGIGDIAGDDSTLRINGAQAAQSTADQGTGNFLAYPAYIGARAGSSLYLNAQLFQLITRFGPNLTSAEIGPAERWVANKTGVTL